MELRARCLAGGFWQDLGADGKHERVVASPFLGVRNMADMNKNPPETSVDEGRRKFLETCGRFAVVTPPAITMLLSTSDYTIAGTPAISTSGGGDNVLHATPANFAAQVAAATPGTTILLATGNYSDWNTPWGGTNKAITVAPEPGASPQITLDIQNSAANFTIDGGHTEISSSTNGMVRAALPFTSTGIYVDGLIRGNPGPKNVTITRCFCGFITFRDGINNCNVLIDRCYFYQLNGGVAAINFDGSSGNPVGAIVQNCYFYDFSSDGVRFDASGIVLQDCEFDTIHPHGNNELHTDCIQWYGGSNCTIRRSFFHNFDQGISAFDGTSSNTVVDNVTMGYPDRSAGHWICLGADNPGSLVQHNTIVDGMVECSSKAGGAVSVTYIRDNIMTRPASLGGSGPSGQPSAHDHNMFPGAASPNIRGKPIYVGGTHPTTYQGFKLASNSPGRGAASDGTDVGARIK
jgi:hypothetical protein